MIRFENVSKTYKGDVVALREVDHDIAKGEFVFLVGPSGSGKSTLLKLLLRDEVATDGKVLVAGRDIGRLGAWKVPQLRRNIGCVFQDYKLLTNKTVYENVAFALEVIGRPKHIIRNNVDLPEPDGPTRNTNSPLATSNVASRSAVTSEL